MEVLTIISRRRIISLTHEIKLNIHTIPSNVLESVQLSQQKQTKVCLLKYKSKTKQDEKQKQIALIKEDIGRINERTEFLNKVERLLDDEFILLVEKAKKDNNMSLISKANAMKRKSSEKRKTLQIQKIR